MVYITDRASRWQDHFLIRATANWQAFVVHLNGALASIYWAKFPAEYLRTIHQKGIAKLAPNGELVELRHTQPYDLFEPQERTEFLRHLIAVFQFIAAGKADIGHVRLPGTVIHKDADAPDARGPGDVPDFVVLDGQVDRTRWLKANGDEYGLCD
jgi:hypothetical protein